MVHISGAVNKPGILRLDSSKRLVDALDLAGGARDDADLDRVNLASRLHDEEKFTFQKLAKSKLIFQVLRLAHHQVILLQR